MSEQVDNRWLLPSKRHPKGYAHLSDSILDPVYYSELVMTLRCNEPVITPTVVRNTLRRIVESRLDDMWDLLDANMDEIVSAARREEPKQH